VAVLGAGHFTNDTYGSVLPAMLPIVLPALGLTVGAGGILVAVNQVVSALLQPLIGHVADRRRLRWPIWVGVALSGLGTCLFGVVPNFWMLAAVVVLAGVGTALFHPVSAASVGALAPPAARGRWMGLYETGGWAGTVAGPLAVGFIIQRAGPGATWPIVIPALVGAAVLIWAAPDRPEIAPQVAPSRGSEKARLGFLSAYLGVATIRTWSYGSAMLFVPLIGSDLGLDAGQTAALLTVLLAAGVLGSLAGGAAADRFGARRSIAAALALTVPVGLVVALASPNAVLLYVVAAGAGFLLTGAYTGLTVAGQQLLPNNAGMVTGLNVGLASGLGGLAVAPLALLAEHVGLRAALALALIAGPLVAVAICPLLASASEAMAATDTKRGSPS
jgi:FSR family fosmidomycin resistance protein-like MFS transporter